MDGKNAETINFHRHESKDMSEWGSHCLISCASSVSDFCRSDDHFPLTDIAVYQALSLIWA